MIERMFSLREFDDRGDDATSQDGSGVRVIGGPIRVEGLDGATPQELNDALLAIDVLWRQLEAARAEIVAAGVAARAPQRDGHRRPSHWISTVTRLDHPTSLRIDRRARLLA